MSSTESIELTHIRNANSQASFTVRSSSSRVGEISEESIAIQRQAVDGEEEREDEYYPEGGWRAYLVIFGSFLGLIVNLGVINSIGAVQAYVSTHQLALVDATSISWIFSIYLALAYALGSIVGPIFDTRGPLELLIASTLLIFVGLMASANSTKVYHFILSFVALGVGNGVGMTPLVGVISHWFNKKRGNFTGIATSGGSVGGLVFPLMLRHTYAQYGFIWAMRIFAFVCLGCMVLSIFLVKGRFKRESKKHDVQYFRSKWNNTIENFSVANFWAASTSKFAFLIAGAFFGELSLVLLLTYFATYAMAQGVSEANSLSLLSVWNATGILGRWIPGYLSDYVGRFNINILMLFSFNISIFALWLPFGSSLKVLFAFAAIGGYCSGSILSLLPACLSQITPVNEIGSKYGLLNTILSIGNLVGLPIASAVIENGSIHNYNNFVLFVGLLSVLGTVFWYTSRFMIVGNTLNVKV